MFVFNMSMGDWVGIEAHEVPIYLQAKEVTAK